MLPFCLLVPNIGQWILTFFRRRGGERSENLRGAKGVLFSLLTPPLYYFSFIFSYWNIFLLWINMLLIELEKKTRDAFKTCLKALSSVLMWILAWNKEKKTATILNKTVFSITTWPFVEVNNDLILEDQVHFFAFIQNSFI